jgi:hypothetical protein
MRVSITDFLTASFLSPAGCQGTPCPCNPVAG